jgi:hypothetical protein
MIYLQTLSTAAIGEASPGSAASWCRFTGKERDSESGLDYFGASFDD